METVLLVVIVLLGAALVVVAMLMLNVVKGLRASVSSLEKKVEGLQAEIAHQQQNLEAVRAVIEKRQDDPFLSVLQTVDRYRSRGFLPAIALVGVRLFKSYLSGKARKKALPLLDKRAE
jgi:cell division protein FtsB